MSQAPAPASPVYWRLNTGVYRLIGIKCNDCGHITYPVKRICPECGSLNVEEYKLSRSGTVHTYCVQWAPPPGFEAPIVPIIVDMEGGGRYQGILTEVTSPDAVKIGDKVEMVFRKVMTDRGLNVYGYKFRLVEEE
jgi:uncharacterized OB-fold protein